jgi:hypothetical protein
MPSSRFRILSLDGGGIKGAFTASILATWEEYTGLRIADHFDLVAGTSTGGIIALAVALGMPARTILDFYRNDGPKIFPTRGWPTRLGLAVSHLLQSKYSREPLKRALVNVFGDKTLSDARCRLILPAYDALRGRIFLFKTAHHPNLSFDKAVTAVDAALATSAAPTYFSPAEVPTQEGNPYVDGGVWANCPTLAALIEAVHFLNIPLNDLDILSVGTTKEPTALLHRLRSGVFGILPFGTLRWAPHIVALLFQAQMEFALAGVQLLTRGRILRIDQDTPTGAYSLDSANRIAELIALGLGKAKERAIIDQVQSRFLNGMPAAPFSPSLRRDERLE